MRRLRATFKEEALLLATNSISPRSWISSSEVLLNCPDFCLVTNRTLLSQSLYYQKLCAWLSLPQWSTEKQLKDELKGGIQLLKSSMAENWKSIQNFVFKAMESILRVLPQLCERLPSWVSAILDLPIFPVATRHGSESVQALGRNVFVPDSVLLNPRFRGKVDLLDFGDNHVWDILPLLRHARNGIQFVSSYDDPKRMAIEIIEPAVVDTDNLDRVKSRIGALNRYLSPPCRGLQYLGFYMREDRLEAMAANTLRGFGKDLALWCVKP